MGILWSWASRQCSLSTWTTARKSDRRIAEAVSETSNGNLTETLAAVPDFIQPCMNADTYRERRDVRSPPLEVQQGIYRPCRTCMLAEMLRLPAGGLGLRTAYVDATRHTAANRVTPLQVVKLPDLNHSSSSPLGPLEHCRGTSPRDQRRSGYRPISLWISLVSSSPLGASMTAWSA